MSKLAGWDSLELALPSPAYLLGSLVFGIVGCVTFRRGRKASLTELAWTGVALTLYPSAISQTRPLRLLGLAMCAWVCWAMMDSPSHEIRPRRRGQAQVMAA